MKTETSHSNAREYIASLAAGGINHFDSREVQSCLGVSADAAKLALNRLAKQEVIASPARGFYVIVPPEYRSLGCLPADQFLPALMKRLGLSYYAGLLSAAQYHGAAHHRPQEFQVFLGKSRRPIQCGAVRVAFMARKRITEVPVQNFNTPRGTILVKTLLSTQADVISAANLSPVVVNELTVLGSRFGPVAQAISMLAQGEVDVVSLIGKRMSLADGPALLTVASQPGVLKVLVDP